MRLHAPHAFAMGKRDVGSDAPTKVSLLSFIVKKAIMMMIDTLSRESMKYIVARLLDNANDAAEEYRGDKSNKFLAGRKLAYYEMLDILRTELDVRDEDLKEFGLDIDLEITYA